MENTEKNNGQNQLGDHHTRQTLPNSTGVLVLGIVSIVFCCCCYGFFGLILGIIALVLSSKSAKLYNASPSLYTEGSYKNMKAGKVCAIIGLCFSSLFFIIGMIYILLYGTAAFIGLSQMPWEEILNQ